MVTGPGRPGLDWRPGSGAPEQVYGALRRSHGEQNARNLNNGKRRLGEDACQGWGTNQRFWQMKCQVKKCGISTPDHLISSPKAKGPGRPGRKHVGSGLKRQPSR